MKEVISARIVETDSGDMEFQINPEIPKGNQIDVLLQLLGRQRQESQPPVPDQMPFAMEDVPVAKLTRWFVGESFEHGPVLGLRHPALGWISFVLPETFPAELERKLGELQQMKKAQHPGGRQ